MEHIVNSEFLFVFPFPVWHIVATMNTNPNSLKHLRRPKSNTIRVRCSDAFHEKLFAAAAILDRDASTIIRDAISEKLDAIAAANPMLRSYVSR